MYNLGLIAACLACAAISYIQTYICYRLFIYPKIKHLPISPNKMKVSDFMIAQACMMSFPFYIAFIATFLLFIYWDWSSGKWDISFLAFFFMFLAMFLIKLKHQKN